jgi:hypothetical protein
MGIVGNYSLFKVFCETKRVTAGVYIVPLLFFATPFASF